MLGAMSANLVLVLLLIDCVTGAMNDPRAGSGNG
ncbi:hypothetical protein THAOC_33498, partial [Thalassiosira oceanica]